MDGRLTFLEERVASFDPVSDIVDLFLGAVGFVWNRVGIGNIIDLLSSL